MYIERPLTTKEAYNIQRNAEKIQYAQSAIAKMWVLINNMRGRV